MPFRSRSSEKTDLGPNTHSGSSPDKPRNERSQPEDALPDGGRDAWLTVLGVFLAIVVSLGLSPLFGIYQRAYLQQPDSRFRDVGAFKLGFVGGTGVGFSFVMGPFANLLVSRFGIRTPALLGVILMTIACQLASISTKFWQLLLSQGILFGIGGSLTFLSSIGLPAQWFDKKRSLATGLAATGGAIGNLMFSPSVTAMINNLSIRWSLRITGFVILGVGLVAVSLLKQRVAIKRVEYKIFDVGLLQVNLFPLFLLYQVFGFFGYAACLFYLPIYSSAIGLSPSNAAGIISVFAACNAVGRIVSGLVADRMGNLNVLIVCNFMTGLFCFVIWLFAGTRSVLMVFAALWGFFYGGYWSLAVPTSAQIVGVQKLGSAVALQFMLMIIPPTFSFAIDFRIVDANGGIVHKDAYQDLVIFCGIMGMAAALALIPVRIHLGRTLLARV